MNYYERHIGDYLKDTAHLSLLEHGIYGRLLDIYYSRETGLPADQITRLVGARTEEEKSALGCVLAEFFILEAGGVYVQARCDREIDRFKAKQAQAKRAAAASVAARQAFAEPAQNGRSTDVDQALNVPSLQSPVPDPKKKKPAAPSLTVEELKAEGLSAETASSFIEHRNRKRAKLTQQAWDGIKTEIQKAGWTAEQAITKALMRGWVAFEADWVKTEREKKADVARATVPFDPREAEASERRREDLRMTPEQREASDRARRLVQASFKNITPKAA